MTREFSAGGVIIRRFRNNLKVLLIKDGYGRWTWPKGNIEKGETSQAAAIREIEEEVGLKKINVIDKIDQVKYFYKLKGELVFKSVFLFLIEADGNDSIQPLKSEIQDAKWFVPDEALKTVEYKGAKVILQKAIDRYREYLKNDKKEKDITC